MILILRHLTLLLWLSTILGLALAFWILPLVNGFFPGHDLPVALAAVAVVLGLTEFAMNLVGKKLVLDALRSAESWDRSGITRRSEQRYSKALERYDMGLISPFKTKGVARALLASLAKFSLTSSFSHPGFKKAVKAFLRLSPGEAEIARLWLKQLCRQKSLTRHTHETVTQVAEFHLDDPEITALCARLFLAAGRTDYTARKVYKAVQTSHTPDPETLSGIKALLVSGTLSHPEFTTMEAPPPPAPEPNVNLAGKIKAMAEGAKRLAAVLPTIFQKAAAPLKTGRAFLQGQERLARMLKWGMVLTGAAVIAGFGISTLFHIVHTPTQKTKVVVNRVEVEIPMRFTIQAAAYLKRIHADEYVAKLKQKGLDAYIYKADGGGRTWFIVRISRFSDRESAAQYGEKLKQQHLIDDFFVDNNE